MLAAGLGKTIQVISLITHLVTQRSEVGRYLVVVPASVLPHWLDELALFSPELKVAAYRGTFDERSEVWNKQVCSCSQLQRCLRRFHLQHV